MVHVAYGYGLFTGGLGAHYGAERLGCTVIPMSGGQTERQVQLIQDFKPRIIMVTPSYMLAVADEFERQGLDPRSCSLEVGIFGAEPWTDLAVKLMLKWPNLYYSTSAFAPKYYPKAIVDYANTRGADKILYAGYWPMGLTLERIFGDLPNVPFRDEVWPRFLRENAIRVFGRQLCDGHLRARRWRWQQPRQFDTQRDQILSRAQPPAWRTIACR